MANASAWLAAALSVTLVLLHEGEMLLAASATVIVRLVVLPVGHHHELFFAAIALKSVICLQTVLSSLQILFSAGNGRF